jgi:hypothetical protein
MKGLVAILLIIFLISSFCISLSSVKAQSEPTLAEAINSISSNIQTSDAWTCVYNQILGLQNQTAFDESIESAVSSQDYVQALLIARLAQVNNYTSATMDEYAKQAFENIPMCGSLPITTLNSYGLADFGSFGLHDRFMIPLYSYARRLNVSSWNITNAYNDFVRLYNVNGVMLCINPKENWSSAYTSRYYDEHAETLAMFTEFYKAEIPEALNYANACWEGVQSHWSSIGYFYDDSNKVVECEMGNFAQIITEYKSVVGNVSNWNRIVEDIYRKVLINSYSSPAWDISGVIQHSSGNPELRLGETMGVLIALQMLYPYFNSELKVECASMIQQLWMNVNSSLLHVGSQYAWTSYCIGTEDATALASMLYVLSGIVPDTGYLKIDASEDVYQDYRTCFPLNSWKFDMTNRVVVLPIITGNLKFIYGDYPITQSFNTSGVYEIHFSSDWNSIVSITKVFGISDENITIVSTGGIIILPSVVLDSYNGINVLPVIMIVQSHLSSGIDIRMNTSIAKNNSSVFVPIGMHSSSILSVEKVQVAPNVSQIIGKFIVNLCIAGVMVFIGALMFARSFKENKEVNHHV